MPILRSTDDFQHVVNNLLNFLNRVLLFPVWYFVYTWKFWYKFNIHLLIIAFDIFGVKPVLNNLFAPFRRDRTFAGYLVGITIRLVWMSMATILMALFFLSILSLTLSFYLAPIVIYLLFEPLYLVPYSLFWLIYYLILIRREEYWDRVVKGNLTRRLAHQIWLRLELDPKEADHVFIQGKEKFIQFLKERKLNGDDYLSTKKWVLDREYRRQSWKFWRDEFFVRRKGVNVGWVAGFLPELKKYSIDLTLRAAEGHLPHIYGRERELDKILRVLRRPSKNNILLVGEAGVGKTSMIYALSWMIIGRRVGIELAGIDYLVKPLEGKRVIELHAAGMIGGTGSRGALEARLNMVFRELKEGETILFINQIETLIQSGMLGYLAPILSSTRFPIIATTTPKVYRESISKMSELASELEVIQIKPPSISETIRILQGFSSSVERKYRVKFTYPALHGAAELSERYIHDLVLPDKAIKILVKAAESKAGNVVTLHDVQEMISVTSSVPVGDLSREESDKLLNLEQLLSKQIVAQDSAVREIARAIRRARTGVRSQERPIAVLLFIGPTGVGKTLTAKTLAQVYFTPQSSVVTSDTEMNQLVRRNFIRFDMSEFSEYGAVVSFISRMTQEVRSKPFALILLDEFEKAEGSIHNLFLQIFEDGRLTNDAGQTVDFRNVIIIATSNAVQKVSEGMIEEAFIHEELGKFFRPELINRFDGIVMFQTLSEQQMKRVVQLELGKLKRRLSEGHEIEISWDRQLIDELAKLGYDPQYGARPLRRIIQNRIEDALAQKLLRKELQSGDTYELTVNDLQ